MSSSARRWLGGIAGQNRCRYASPYRRTTSATSHMTDLGRLEIGRQVVHRVLHRLHDVLSHVQVQGGRLQAPVSQEPLNHADVEALFHQVRGIRMAQRVARDAFGNAALPDRILEKMGIRAIEWVKIWPVVQMSRLEGAKRRRIRSSP